MNKFVIKLIAGSAIAMAGTSVFAADECGDVSIADMKWSSATLLANVDAFILEHGYGCTVDIVPGDTMPTGTSMIEKGEPDIAPEFWIGNFIEALDRGVQEKRLRMAGRSLSDGGQEGWWVPQYMVDEHPELATLEGVMAHPELFEHPEDPSVAMFMGCPAGWGCQINNENLFKAFKMDDKGFELVDPGSSAGLSGAIAKAYERKEGWFGYYWAPTAILGNYKMVMVDFGTGIDKEYFDSCITQADCDATRGSMYPRADVYSITTESFASESPKAYDYIAKRSVTNAVMNEVLAWIDENQADGDYAAEYFLKNYASIWTPWVSADVAKRVQSEL